MNFLIRDVLIVPPLGESPFDGWVEIVTIRSLRSGADAATLAQAKR
jgi:hypothetical protein